MRVAIILTARPSYAKLKPVIRALLAQQVDVQLLACASALLERYGKVVDRVRFDFPTLAITECWSTYEGATLLTSAKETGALTSELCSALSTLRPDLAVVCADRHEVLGAAQAVAFLHVPLLHLQGGEHTGSIDDKVRNSVTHLADLHCVATARAKQRVYALTGAWDAIHQTGCPSIDLAHEALSEPPVTAQELGGAGGEIDLMEPFVVVLQHPVTSETDHDQKLDETVLAATAQCAQVLCFWPGQDAGADAMSKALRGWGETVHTVRSLPPQRFLKLLTQAQCLLGNSSAGIREASYLGVPVVNIGPRQCGRERAKNVIDVGYDFQAISAALTWQMEHGRYASSVLYGQGTAGQQIAEVITGERTRDHSCALRQ